MGGVIFLLENRFHSILLLFVIYFARELIIILLLASYFATNLPILPTGKVKKIPPELLAVLKYSR